MSKSIAQKCKIKGCYGKGKLSQNGKRYPIKGWCTMHYKRLINNGDPLVVRRVVGENRSSHSLYKTYCGMKDRCLNPNSSDYRRYGNRGITISQEWLGVRGFNQFVKDMGEKPEGTSLDRIDNDGNYSAENCRWATHHQQAANRAKRELPTGVSYITERDVWVAQLKVNGKNVLIKRFKTKEEAIEARRQAEITFKIR